MLHTNNPVSKHKAGLLNLADEGSVEALINRSHWTGRC